MSGREVGDLASWEDLCRGWCSRLVWPTRMAQQRRKIKDLGNGKAAKGAKVLKRGEKIEPITQVKELGITRRKQTSTVRKRKKNTHLLVDFWGGCWCISFGGNGDGRVRPLSHSCG